MEKPSGQAEGRTRHKSFTYSTRLQRVADRAGTLSSEGKPPLRVASPPEFKGEASVWTPEDLLVAALEACTMTTFISVAEKNGTAIRDYQSSAEGQLEYSDGAFRFTRVVVRPRVELMPPATEETARALFEKTHGTCFITNSVRCEVVIDPTVIIVPTVT